MKKRISKIEVVISGAQGSGKTTMAEFITKMARMSKYRVEVWEGPDRISKDRNPHIIIRTKQEVL